jgi:hypothetical protein
MAGISERLRREFKRARKAGIISLAACREGERKGEEIKTVDQLIREGYDPVHALYLNVNNLISLFAEQVTVLPMFHRAHSILLKTQDMYTPGYPPMSPITVSYYGCWTIYDLPIGKDDETLGGCFAALSDLLELDALQIEAARNLCQSRMGIYEVLGASGAGLRLRELVTDRKFEAVIPSGFKGRAGDLILIRLLPPVPECGLPWVGMTTPYVLVGCREGDWLEYFKRHQILPGTVGCQERLRRHLKVGTDQFYWSEFVFWGYVNFRSDAIFLAGFPDQPHTQPAHNSFDPTTLDLRRVAAQMA